MHFSFLRKKAPVQELNGSMIDVLTYQQVIAKPRRFTTKREMVAEVATKYRGLANLGNQVVQRIVNLRSAFVLHNGIRLERGRHGPTTPAEPQSGSQQDASASRANAFAESPEARFLSAFIDRNDLNESLAVELVKESEIEGQVLVQLVWNPDLKNVEVKYLSWLETDYRIVPNPRDYTQVRWIEWDDDEDQPVRIDPDQAVFIKFNTRLNSYEGHPTVGTVLRECEELDAALRDWRTINGLFAKLTPYFKVPDERAADLIAQKIAKSGWQLGSAFASSAEFSLVGPSVAPAEMLSREITSKIKIISGATGVGVHHLGFADVMSNRATAEAMQQPVELAAQADITRWRKFYEELFAKAIRLRNKHLNGQLDEHAIKPKLVGATQAQLAAITEIWLPLYREGAIDKETLRAKVPDLDS